MANEKKTYVPMSSAKQITFKDGGSLLRLGFKADELIAFVQMHQNERGWINFTVTERRQPGERGDTHSVALDTYQPKSGGKAQFADDVAAALDSADIPF